MSSTKVIDLKVFLPAKDLAVSKQFYLDLGFHEVWDSGDACELEIENHRFILTNVYLKEHAENCMMSLNVEDVDAWWERITNLGLQSKYKLGMASSPALQPWGLRVLYLSDPSGVLWHIAARPTS
ncbi:VOC family protein [Tundrisphaera lichenicola]|uniref:VOC family protein n=1 Tax=Tundrisphaera lichenicola TaxID=2029860 RepID=UPI003EBA124A